MAPPQRETPNTPHTALRRTQAQNNGVATTFTVSAPQGFAGPKHVPGKRRQFGELGPFPSPDQGSLALLASHGALNLTLLAALACNAMQANVQDSNDYSD